MHKVTIIIMCESMLLVVLTFVGGHLCVVHEHTYRHPVNTHVHTHTQQLVTLSVAVVDYEDILLCHDCLS